MTARNLLRQGADRLGIGLSDSETGLLLRYFEELKKWSRRINLIAKATDDTAILENHFLDSLTLLPIIEQEQARSLLDVGTGAGFPGLVLAAVLPEVTFTLVEPRNKRVSFLKHIVRTLQLANVEIVADRIEALDGERTLPFDLVTSRAVAAPDQFLPMVSSYLEQGSKAVIMAARTEVFAAMKQPSSLYTVAQMKQHQLPFSGASRVLGVVCLDDA